MAKLILRRLHQWPDIRQSYEIQLDGTPVVSIGSEKTVEIEVAPGLHEITATMGPFLGSQPVRLDIAPGGDHRVEVGMILRNPPLLAIGLTLMVWLFLAVIAFLGAPFANVAARFFCPLGLFLGTLLLGLSPLVARVACATRWHDRYLDIRPIAPAARAVPRGRARSGWSPRLSVRGLMVAVLVLGGLLGLHLHRARLQREAVSAIKRAGGSVRYHWEPEGRLVGVPVNPTWWESAMARLGPDHFGRVVWVGFNGSPIGEPDDGVMAYIARLQDLEELDFSPINASHPSVSDAGLAYLRGLSRLRWLDLSRTGVRGPGLAHLQGMNQLERLELLELPLEDEDLIHLGGLTSLEVLTLSSDGITDDGLAHLSGLKLRQLRLESPWISGAGLRHVGAMTGLRCLVLNSPRLDSLLPLGHLTELVWVGLDGTAVGDADMAILARSKGLFHLNLSHTQVGDAGLARLGELSKIEHLALSDTRVTDRGLASLTGLSKCWYLSVQGTGVTDGGVAQLSAKFPAIRVNYRQTAVKPGL
jgi:hypothetical protein